MAGRLRQVTELYETELQRVTAERAEWMGFLRYAAAHLTSSASSMPSDPGRPLCCPWRTGTCSTGGGWRAAQRRLRCLTRAILPGGSCGFCLTLRTRWRPIRRGRFRGLRCCRMSARRSSMRWKALSGNLRSGIRLSRRCVPSHRTSCGSGCRRSCGRCWSVWMAVFWKPVQMRRSGMCFRLPLRKALLLFC